MIRLVLPYPPSVNRYYRRVGHKTIISRSGRQYREDVLSICWQPGIRRAPLLGELEVELHYYPPDRRRRDIDNLQKAILDALQHANIYEDDSQIVRLVIEKCGVVSGGSATVAIRVRDKKSFNQIGE